MRTAVGGLLAGFISGATIVFLAWEPNPARHNRVADRPFPAPLRASRI